MLFIIAAKPPSEMIEKSPYSRLIRLDQPVSYGNDNKKRHG
jgi:hypothetical protein